jgi:hypothetical protein
MKEKRYTLPEEQKDAAFAAEPAPAYHGNAAIALPEDECAEEDIDWNKIPVGWHPANEEEAMARIEAIEEEYERTGISYSVEDDLVIFVDLWDMRKSPRYLIRQFKRKL